MNDFTKDELEDLYSAIRHCYMQDIDLPSDTDIERFSYDLMSKIYSMIKNYCDHEPHGDFHVCVDKCKKCGVIIIE